jgi:hypothetical protein
VTYGGEMQFFWPNKNSSNVELHWRRTLVHFIFTEQIPHKLFQLPKFIILVNQKSRFGFTRMEDT